MPPAVPAGSRGSIPSRPRPSGRPAGRADELPGRGPAGRRGRAHAPRQPDLVLLLPRPRARALARHPLHRAGPRGHGPLRRSRQATTTRSPRGSPTSRRWSPSLGLRRVHLVVHDWGGAIGLGFAGRHPERIGRIVILNTAAFPSQTDPRADRPLPRPRSSAPSSCAGLNGFAEAATWMAMASRRLTWDERRALPPSLRQLGGPDRRPPLRAATSPWRRTTRAARRLRGGRSGACRGSRRTRR